MARRGGLLYPLIGAPDSGFHGRADGHDPDASVAVVRDAVQPAYAQAPVQTQYAQRSARDLLFQASQLVLCLAVLYPIIVSTIWLIGGSWLVARHETRLCIAVHDAGLGAGAPPLLQGFVTTTEFDGRWNVSWDLSYARALVDDVAGANTSLGVHIYALTSPMDVFVARACCWASETPTADPLLVLTSRQSGAPAAPLTGWTLVRASTAVQLRTTQVHALLLRIRTTAPSPNDTVYGTFATC